MITLESITSGLSLTGLDPTGIGSVIAVVPIADGAVQVLYKTPDGALLALVGGKAEAVRQLAYRLYTLCERLGQAEDARAYNELITSWTGIESAANSVPKPANQQRTLFDT